MTIYTPQEIQAVEAFVAMRADEIPGQIPVENGVATPGDATR